jgi:predicted Zn finger-like uncharacterized protein
MDVICDRCKAEYEFDEALLGDKGTTVKCSACGHVFRVLPPNRDAGRSQLKLRFSKDGTVKSLGSLRELQQRIRAGEVSLDDELGREGFPFRLLRDVPELKNFFMSAPPPDMSRQPERATQRPEPSHAAPLPDAPTRAHDRPPTQRKSAFATVARDAGATAVPTGETLLGSAPTARAPLGASGSTRQAEPRPAPQRPPAAQTVQPGAEVATSPESRSRSFSKHTMMGVGPDDLQLPPPPRVPQFGGSPTSAAKPSPTSPVRERVVPSTSDKTLHGMPVVAPSPGPQPSTPAHAARPASAAPPPLKPSVRPPASASMDRGGTLPAVSAAAAAAVAAAPPQSYSASASMAPGTDAGVAPTGGQFSAGAGNGSSGYEPAARRGVAPFDLASSAFPQVEGEVERLPQLEHARSDGPLEPPPKLYLDDEERPPERATQAGSKIWLYVALLLLIGGGTYFAASKLDLVGRLVGEPEPVVAPEPSASVDAAVAEAAPDAGSETNSADNGYPTPEFAPPVTTGGATTGAGSASAPAAAPSEPAPAPGKADKPNKASEAAPQEPTAGKAAREKRSAEPASAVDEPAKADKPAADKPERSARAADDPSDYAGWVSRGDQLFSKGDHEGASKAYKAAIALRPSGSEANAGLGFALLNGGHARESLPYFDRASSSGYAEANIGLGDAYRKLGQPSSAKEAYQAYLDRLPTGARADYARSALDKLKGGGSSSDKPAGDKPTEDKPQADKPTSEPRPPASDYRPAGELIEPTAPPTTAPSEAAP